MTTTRTFITREHTTAAARAAKAVAEAKNKGLEFDGNVHTISDQGRKGLRIINVGGVASWVFKTSKHTKTLGYIYPPHYRPIAAPEKAREVGGYVKSLLDEDPSRVDAYLEAWHVHQDHAKALESLKVKTADTWTFEQCINRMLEDRQKPDSDAFLKPMSVKDVKGTFNRDCFDKIKKTPATLLARADFEKVRDTVRDNVGISPAKKVITHSRTVFDWMARHHSGQSGIDGRDPWWQMLHAPYRLKARDRRPAVEDIIKTLILAEEYLEKPLPGRAISTAGVGAGVLAGLWWIVMTAQRGKAATSLRAYNLVDDGERGGGWKIAMWEPDQMKAGVTQMLPIPPRAAAIIENIRAKAKHCGSEAWAFPSDRDPEKHATPSGVYRILYRLAGRDALLQPEAKHSSPTRKLPERKTPRLDLLAEADIPWWSGHDVRRTIQEVLDDAGIPGGASVILAHEMKSDIDLTAPWDEQQREDFMRNRVAKITKKAYGTAQYPKLKAEAMQVWTDALLDEYDRQKAMAQGAGTAS